MNKSRFPATWCLSRRVAIYNGKNADNIGTVISHNKKDSTYEVEFTESRVRPDPDARTRTSAKLPANTLMSREEIKDNIVLSNKLIEAELAYYKSASASASSSSPSPTSSNNNNQPPSIMFHSLLGQFVMKDFPEHGDGEIKPFLGRILSMTFRGEHVIDSDDDDETQAKKMIDPLKSSMIRDKNGKVHHTDPLKDVLLQVKYEDGDTEWIDLSELQAETILIGPATSKNPRKRQSLAKRSVPVLQNVDISNGKNPGGPIGIYKAFTEEQVPSPNGSFTYIQHSLNRTALSTEFVMSKSIMRGTIGKTATEVLYSLPPRTDFHDNLAAKGKDKIDSEHKKNANRSAIIAGTLNAVFGCGECRFSARGCDLCIGKVNKKRESGLTDATIREKKRQDLIDSNNRQIDYKIKQTTKKVVGDEWKLSVIKDNSKTSFGGLTEEEMEVSGVIRGGGDDDGVGDDEGEKREERNGLPVQQRGLKRTLSASYDDDSTSAHFVASSASSNRGGVHYPLALSDSTPITLALRAAGVKNSGYGLIALSYIPENTFVSEYIGEFLTSEQVNKREEYYYESNRRSERDNTTCYLMSNGSSSVNSTCIDSTLYSNASRFINQSCNCNLVFKTIDTISDFAGYKKVRIGFYTLPTGGGISKGTELTVCYNPNSSNREETEIGREVRKRKKDADSGASRLKCCCGYYECKQWL